MRKRSLLFSFIFWWLTFVFFSFFWFLGDGKQKSSKAKETPWFHCRRSSLVNGMIEINRKGLLLVLVFTVIATLETALAVTQITDSNFHSAIATCLGTNPVDGLCSSSEYGSNARLGCEFGDRYEWWTG